MVEIKNLLKCAIIIQVFAVITIVFDIPVARQMIGFVYLSFLPGILLLQILGLNFKSIFEQLAFSLGLSLAFCMFVGVAANSLCSIVGFSTPLSILPLEVTIGSILAILSIIVSKKDGSKITFALPDSTQILSISFLIGLPILAIFAGLFTDTFLHLSLFTTVIVVVLAIAFSKKIEHYKLYSIVILVIAFSVIFQRELLSNYILGWDVFGEFYVFKQTEMASLWIPSTSIAKSEILDYNSMLSVTILPAIYSNLLNASGELIFKVFYFLFYCFVPLTLYQMYKRGFGRFSAFLSAFYFLSYPRFWGEERRQIIGELFFVLLIATIITQDTSWKKKKILCYVFGAALIVSHYSLFYIFLSFAIFVWLAIHILRKLSIINYSSEWTQIIDGPFIMILSFLAILWFIFVNSAHGITIMDFLIRVTSSFFESFGAVESRGAHITSVFDPGIFNRTLIFQADLILNKIPFVLIIIGFIAFARNYKKRNVSLEYLFFAAGAVIMLFSILLVPFLAPAFMPERFYHVSLLFLAPICVYGGLKFLGWIITPLRRLKHAIVKPEQILAIFFIALFLFRVGFFYEIAGDTSPGMQISTSFNRMKDSNDPQLVSAIFDPYVPAQDVYSAVWLANTLKNNTDIYADKIAEKHVLRAYALKIIEWNYALTTNTTFNSNTYVYLRYLNVQGYLIQNGAISNMTDVYSNLVQSDLIYSNGGSEIYYNPELQTSTR